MNTRKALYFAYLRAKGSSLPGYYERYCAEDQAGFSPIMTRELLVQLLAYCQRMVPYYAQIMRELGGSFQEDPEAYLERFPILTKDIIRSQLRQLRSADLAQRRWYYNTSGGSTGEPVRFIQDAAYMDRSYPITLLFALWAGKELGEREVRVWGSEREIIEQSTGWRALLGSKLINVTYYNAYRLAPNSMRDLARVLNTRPPKLTVGYAEALSHVARFLAREGVAVRPQAAVMTSAGTLYPFMREQITSVFQCPVFDRYGSREVGDVACQCQALGGLHVPPWGNYLEIVDEAGRRVPDGIEGEILITSLCNYAMPLIRYRIGDRGILATQRCPCGRAGQLLERLVGRHGDVFRRRDGTYVDPGYFASLLYFKDWIIRFQIVQESYSRIVFKIVRAGPVDAGGDLAEITANAKLLMGDDCEVAFEFTDDIGPTPSGKYRHTISEVQG